jgi:hypothetical protein
MFDKHRFEVWSTVQHPLKHSLSDFGYTNPALPGVSDINSAFNWIFKVLYPVSKPAVADVASLPLLGNTLNDYRVVIDDGDGNQAGYRWEQREGEVSPSWHKIFDFDWSTDSILAAFTDITQDLYVYQKGKSDLDSAGAVITGLYAGQKIYGGNVASQNLTLAANSGDGTGAHTGFVQVDDNFRPTVTGTYGLGNASFRWSDAHFAVGVYANTLSLIGGQITDSTGTISFDNENLVTTGNITGVTGFFTTSIEVGPLAGNAVIIGPGSYEDETGSIDWNAANFTNIGSFTISGSFTAGDITIAVGSITASGGVISFGNENLSTTGTLGAGDTTVTRLDSDNIRLDGNTISITNANGNLILVANGTGIIDAQSALTTLGITATGTVSVTGQLNADNLRFDGNVISSQNLNGNITLTPNGTGAVETSSRILPAADGTLSLGSAAARFDDLFLAGDIGDGTTVISSATLQSLRDINVGVAAGFSLFYDGAKWVASSPDTEITHGSLSGLTTGDAGHTQFALLAGRAGGQDLVGGTAASNNLTLESTSNATKGSVLTKNNFKAFTAPAYSGGWTGIDLGGVSNEFRNVYTKGEFVGFRLENYTFATLPSNSAQNIGRLAYATDTEKIYADNGTAWVTTGGSTKILVDTVWNGTDTTKDVDVSATITDARESMWALHDNANDFDRIYCSIKAISATDVRITVSPALPAGSYRLIGLE